MTGARVRTLVIDENLHLRLAAELRGRGRHAVSVSELGLIGSSDPRLLDRLDALLPDWVLVTADDDLPLEHGVKLAAAQAAVATIDPDRGAAWPLEAYRRDVVHRWAHAIDAQRRGSTRRYGLASEGAWVARPRRPRGG